MSDNSGSMGAALIAIIVIACVLFGAGYWAGHQTAEEIYVFESQHPVRPQYSETLPSKMEDVEMVKMRVLNASGGFGDEYLFFYWCNGDTLYWTYSKVGK